MMTQQSTTGKLSALTNRFHSRQQVAMTLFS
jgi:hypothetical protein